MSESGDDEKDEAKARGGHARAESLSPEERSEIAKRAAQARWSKPEPPEVDEDMAMTDKNDLFQARNEMLGVLDEKLAKMPEWKAFRAMEKALAAMSEAPPPRPNRHSSPLNDQPPPVSRRGRNRRAFRHMSN